MSTKPPLSWKRRALVVAVAVVGALVVYRIVSFQLRERRIAQVKIGMPLAEVSALLGDGRPIDAFESELTRCPPDREPVIFDGNPGLILRGSWEDYVKVGVVDGVVCDVSRLGL